MYCGEEGEVSLFAARSPPFIHQALALGADSQELGDGAGMGITVCSLAILTQILSPEKYSSDDH